MRPQTEVRPKGDTMQQLANLRERIQGTGQGAALSRADMERLSWLKIRIERGTISEFPMEHKRMVFARFLYERNLIHE
jgi:hypothetical protein